MNHFSFGLYRVRYGGGLFIVEVQGFVEAFLSFDDLAEYFGW